MAGITDTFDDILQLTKSWAAEFGPNGVNVNAIAPGPIYTPGTAGDEELLAQLVSIAPARRIGQATELVGAAVFLASDEASYVHGITLPVEGGSTATSTRKEEMREGLPETRRRSLT
ncbi:hypothetical protein KDH_29110 [Dictyobacter sp. S3.2.2.5]|uniref:Uncharacterized protein n=1 Tax=Dictyobacter halimunensis TaxID=3026934 RepID=A0ABQ6FQQ5_9CHLR|nr:hypothetical protein KDH_29110 [Dictyobacter sp. S3.2.2.5]